MTLNVQNVVYGQPKNSLSAQRSAHVSCNDRLVKALYSIIFVVFSAASDATKHVELQTHRFAADVILPVGDDYCDLSTVSIAVKLQ